MYQSAIDCKYCKKKTKSELKPFLTSNHIKVSESPYTTFLWSADLSKNFSQLIMSIFIFSQYFFNRFCIVEKCGFNPHCLYHDSWIMNLSWISNEKLRKNCEWYYDKYFFCQKHLTSDFIFTEINMIEVIQFTLYNSQTILWIKSEVDMNYNNICIF